MRQLLRLNYCLKRSSGQRSPIQISGMMAGHIVIAGGTGFIGRKLSAALIAEGFEVVVLTRSIKENLLHLRHVRWSSQAKDWHEVIEGAQAVINLAGDNIASGLWTETKKGRLLDSRLETSRALTEAVNSCKNKPELFLQSSAIGFYGDRQNQLLTEDSTPGEGFLAELVAAWEREVAQIDKKVKVVYLRIGLVLGLDGGLIAKMKPLFKAGIGGHVGSGEQYMSWIHLDDIIGIIFHLLANKKAGVYNLTAPNPVKGREFFKTLAKQLGRKSWLHLPSFIIKLAPGQMGQEIFLASQRVASRNLPDYNFKFSFLEMALADLLNEPAQTT